MILPFRSKLVQIQNFKRSFTKVDNDKLISTLVILFEDLDSWKMETSQCYQILPFSAFFSRYQHQYQKFSHSTLTKFEPLETLIISNFDH